MKAEQERHLTELDRQLKSCRNVGYEAGNKHERLAAEAYKRYVELHNADPDRTTHLMLPKKKYRRN